MKILRYVKGTVNVGLWYPKESILSLVGYPGANYAGMETDFNWGKYAYNQFLKHVEAF